MAVQLTTLAAGLPASVPFVGPEAQERAAGRPFRARLGANESLFGPSPAALEAMRAAAAEVWRYGDPENHDLKAALARHHGVGVQNVCVGEGIDGLLGLLVRLLVEPGRPVVTSAGAYPTFAYHVRGFGGVLHAMPYRDDAEDPAALAAAARQTGARLVYLANPDNPMGTWHRAAVLRELIDALPPACLLCLDEAYAEFAPQDAILPLDVTDDRVIRMRTFSKAYGLAGARIGYVLGARDLIAAFDRVRNHFGVNRLAQAGALASLADQTHLRDVVGRVAAGRRRLREIAARSGLAALPSAANFVAIDCGQDGAFATRVLSALLDRGIFVRKPGVAPQDRCIRITVGTDPELEMVATALPEALAAVERCS